jgi:hypothetical protein
MSKKDLQRKEQCFGCHNINRCEKHWGYECKRNGGTRIPVMRVSPQQLPREIIKPIEPIARPKRAFKEEPIKTIPGRGRFLGIIPREKLLGVQRYD